MDEAELQSAILRLLARWEWLPETDLLRWLSPVEAVSYGPGTAQRLADAGLVEVREVGDERVLKLTERGRAAAQGAGQPL